MKFELGLLAIGGFRLLAAPVAVFNWVIFLGLYVTATYLPEMLTGLCST